MTRKFLLLFCTTSLLIFISVTNVLGSSNKPRKLYLGYKLIRLDNITTEYKDVLIQSIARDRDTVQLWRIPKVNNTVEILVGQSRLGDVLEYLEEIEVSTEIIQEDISVLLNEERESYMASAGSSLTWDSYHDYQDIINYFINQTRSQTGQPVLTPEIIGKSELGRDIYVFRVAKEAPEVFYPNPEDHRRAFKPAIWIDAGLFGRDWLAIASSSYILDKFMSGDLNKILNSYDIYVAPLLNPDSYHYTRTTDRFWAKNLGVRVNYKGCEGVNLDSNFALMFRGELMEKYVKGTGIAHNACSDYYGGSVTHIESEVTSLARAVWAKREQITLYLSLQSYSQTWLIPQHPPRVKGDFEELTALAEIGNAALREVAGRNYTISSWEYSQSESPGKCIDWMKQVAGIKYSYGLKLPDDGSSMGYLISANEIRSVGEEIIAAVSAMALAKLQN